VGAIHPLITLTNRAGRVAVLAFSVELIDRSASDLHAMFTRTYGQLYEQNAHMFTSLFADLRAYYSGTDLDLGTVVQAFFSTLMTRMFRLLNAQYAFDADYLDCVRSNVDDLSPFGDVPQKLGVQLKRSLVATRTYYQGLVVGRQVVTALMTVSSLLHSVNLILFSLLLVHLILHASPYHSHRPGRLMDCNFPCTRMHIE